MPGADAEGTGGVVPAHLEEAQRTAIALAEASLRAGESGFGAVLLDGEEIVASGRDSERADRDPTAHAELAAIRQASTRFGRDLSPLTLVSTHEPCPMCATAALWAGVGEIAYGVSIAEAIRQGRRRVALPVAEIYERAGRTLVVHEGVLRTRCAPLYDESVRKELALLRVADEAGRARRFAELEAELAAWCRAHPENLEVPDGDPLAAGRRLLLAWRGVSESEAPAERLGPACLVFSTPRLCPVTEACRILGLDWDASGVLLSSIDPRLAHAWIGDREQLVLTER